MATKTGKGDTIPAFMAHVLMDYRSKLAVDTRLTRVRQFRDAEACKLYMKQGLGGAFRIFLVNIR